MADVEPDGRRIMVAVDEGDESMYALSWCLRNFITPDSEDTLVLLYVKPPRVVFGGGDGAGYLFDKELIASVERYSNQIADSVLRKANEICASFPNVKVETVIEKGDPRDVICSTVTKVGADVLLLGTHGYGMIKRALLGSVSVHCAHHAKCPVLIVKRPKH